MNKLKCNGMNDSYEVLNVWLNKPNGNGLYLVRHRGTGNVKLVEVYDNGYLTSWFTVYENDTFSNDLGYCRNIMRSKVEVAIRYARKHGFEL